MQNELITLQPVDLDAGQVFSGQPSGNFIKGYADSSTYTPKPDPDYLFHESSRDVVVGSWKNLIRYISMVQQVLVNLALLENSPPESITLSLKLPAIADWKSRTWSAT